MPTSCYTCTIVAANAQYIACAQCYAKTQYVHHAFNSHNKPMGWALCYLHFIDKGKEAWKARWHSRSHRPSKVLPRLPNLCSLPLHSSSHLGAGPETSNFRDLGCWSTKLGHLQKQEQSAHQMTRRREATMYLALLPPIPDHTDL